MLADLPDYQTGESSYGEILLDSQWAHPDLYLAHSGILMPVYPLREISGDVAANTLRYAEENQSIGSHNFNWMAAAAASLGMGDEAVRILYELGIVYMMRPTGLFTESTDRSIQACSVLFPTCYCPPIMESGSGTVAALNEMLLQSRPEGIAVFPAVPSKWKDLSFSRLLAEGAFEVSATMRGGATINIEINSLAGGECRLINPWHDREIVLVDQNLETRLEAGQDSIVLSTKKANVYQLRPAEIASEPVPGEMERIVQPIVRPTNSGRRVFVGHSDHTRFLEQLDRFLLNPKLGRFEIVKATRYKLDFGSHQTEKDYAEIAPNQFLPPNKYGADLEPVGSASSFQTCCKSGYGWMTQTSLAEVDRGGPDCLRRDFIVGTQDAEFDMLLTKGSYQALIVAGDAAEAGGLTRITFPDGHIWESRANVDVAGFDVSTVSLKYAKMGSRRSSSPLNRDAPGR